MEQPTPRPGLHWGAMLSFLLGVASFALCLLALSGVPAMLIGYRSLRSVNARGGPRSAAWLAIGGMVLGCLATISSLVGVGAVIVVQLQIRAARTTCQDNLRRVGLSLEQYAERRERFPPAVIGPHDLPPERQLAWTCEVVPALGLVPKEGPQPNKAQQQRLKRYYEELADRIDRDEAWDGPANADAVATSIRAFLCPGAPGFDPNGSPGLTNYVGLTGIGPDAARVKREDPRAGAFGYDRGVKLSEITAGTSHLITVTETCRDVGPWPAGGPPTVRDLDPDADWYFGPGRPFGGTHPRMANLLYADGSVRPTSDRGEAEVIRQQATLRR